MWHKYKTNIRKDYIDANLVDGANKKGGVVRLMQDPDLK
jgi:hypothetical protein